MGGQTVRRAAVGSRSDKKPIHSRSSPKRLPAFLVAEQSIPLTVVESPHCKPARREKPLVASRPGRRDGTAGPPSTFLFFFSTVRQINGIRNRPATYFPCRYSVTVPTAPLAPRVAKSIRSPPLPVEMIPVKSLNAALPLTTCASLASHEMPFPLILPVTTFWCAPSTEHHVARNVSPFRSRTVRTALPSSFSQTDFGRKGEGASSSAAGGSAGGSGGLIPN